MSFWRRRDLATPRPIGSNAAVPEESVVMDREAYIRLLVDGYRTMDMPIPGWLQTEWDEMGLVDPEPPPSERLLGNEDIEVWAVVDVGQGQEKMFPMKGEGAKKFSAVNVPYTGTVVKAQLRDRKGNVLGDVSLSHAVPTCSGDTFVLELNLD